MVRNLIRSFFPEFYRKLSQFYYWNFRPRISRLNPFLSGTLVYIGGNYGESLMQIAHRFRRVIVFECNPFLVSLLSNRFRFFSHVEIYALAASDSFGNIELNIANNGNFFGSSSIENLSRRNPIRSETNVTVNKVNLGSFLRMINVETIDFYVSDIEGHDFVALKSCDWLLRNRKIAKLQVEVWQEESLELFDAPEIKITEKDFAELLGDDYMKSNQGLSNFLRLDNPWEIIPNSPNLDILWKAKDFKRV
jgi:FkbM family methyltransferase